MSALSSTPTVIYSTSELDTLLLQTSTALLSRIEKLEKEITEMKSVAALEEEIAQLKSVAAKKRTAPEPAEPSAKREKIEVSDVQPWDCWCDTFFCKLCGKGPYSRSFEFSYKRDGGVSNYVSEGCHKCTKALVMQDAQFGSPEFWKLHRNGYRQYREMGLIDEMDLGPEEPTVQEPALTQAS